MAKLEKGYKIVGGNKVVLDTKAAEARLDVSTRLKRRKSKKVTVKKPVIQDYRP